MITENWHTAGEPFRIVQGIVLPGDDIARRMLRATTSEADDIRRFLCLEPRGHGGMYGGFITAPDDDGADFGVLFWHREGFASSCGHGVMGWEPGPSSRAWWRQIGRASCRERV